MATDIATRELRNPIDLVEYLFRRVYEVGVRTVHGVPGKSSKFRQLPLDIFADYAVYCQATTTLRLWITCHNAVSIGQATVMSSMPVRSCSSELDGVLSIANPNNPGYATDGYARVNGIGALVTTFGVGELSAINAIAGAYSEFVPIIHIVGQPNTRSQKDGKLLHHTLGNGDFNVFTRMNAEISCCVARFDDPHEAPTLIDNAIRECFIRSRPVLITLPTDVVTRKVEGERLKKPIDLTQPQNDPEKEDYVVEVVLKYLQQAKNPVILVDACAIRHRVLDEVHDLVQKSGLPTFVAPMGKGAVDETHKNYGGVYAGSGSNAGVREQVESSDLILSIGAIKSDFNTAGFTYRIGQLNAIDFHSTLVRVRYSEYPNIHMKGVLRKMIQKLGSLKLSAPEVPPLSNRLPDEEKHSTDKTVTHKWFWPMIGQWLKPNDIVITETGTANFGIWETRFPPGVTAISQVLWGSIGYSVGACQGAAAAAKEQNKRRTILFVGDGSFQLTVQELSTMIRNKLNPIMLVHPCDKITL